MPRSDPGLEPGERSRRARRTPRGLDGRGPAPGTLAPISTRTAISGKIPPSLECLGLSEMGSFNRLTSRKPALSAAVIARVVHMTLHEKPPAATHWSISSMAQAAGISRSSVQRIWKAHGLHSPGGVHAFLRVRHKAVARSSSAS